MARKAVPVYSSFAVPPWSAGSGPPLGSGPAAAATPPAAGGGLPAQARAQLELGLTRVRAWWAARALTHRAAAPPPPSPHLDRALARVRAWWDTARLALASEEGAQGGSAPAGDAPKEARGWQGEPGAPRAPERVAAAVSAAAAWARVRAAAAGGAAQALAGALRVRSGSQHAHTDPESPTLEPAALADDDALKARTQDSAPGAAPGVALEPADSVRSTCTSAEPEPPLPAAAADPADEASAPAEEPRGPDTAEEGPPGAGEGPGPAGSPEHSMQPNPEPSATQTLEALRQRAARVLRALPAHVTAGRACAVTALRREWAAAQDGGARLVSWLHAALRVAERRGAAALHDAALQLRAVSARLSSQAKQAAACAAAAARAWRARLAAGDPGPAAGLAAGAALLGALALAAGAALRARRALPAAAAGVQSVDRADEACQTVEPRWWRPRRPARARLVTESSGVMLPVSFLCWYLAAEYRGAALRALRGPERCAETRRCCGGGLICTHGFPTCPIGAPGACARLCSAGGAGVARERRGLFTLSASCAALRLKSELPAGRGGARGRRRQRRRCQARGWPRRRAGAAAHAPRLPPWARLRSRLSRWRPSPARC